ncbi:DoxX family protein [Bremerella sp. T1]|uniref:DoxX family protein n=1 Tax=Bremerella sp. TYQ1 TaxID=3119568 RepID=UPI001CCCA75B|nr:DoxX family protein [Bremerella volcania]UBM35725.1 DoxX family protein [Bremerella volcania]
MAAIVQPSENDGKLDNAWSICGLPGSRYALLLIAVVAQALTIGITWPLWQVRISPVHMPAIDLPQIPFGVWMLATLVLVIVRPRLGLAVHAASLLLSFVFDQYRTQPQVIAMVMLMFAVVEDCGVVLVRWFLASLWLWAGLHKLLSPDWFTFASWYMVKSLHVNPENFQRLFAYGVGLGELAVGLLAIFRPRWAAIPCAMMHVGITLFLTPLFYDHNISVMPWNLATAIIGGWVMWNAPSVVPRFRWEWGLAGLLLIYPAGFYAGWVDHGIASVLYSHHLPEAMITTKTSNYKITGWGDLEVPFPNERRLFKLYFERAAKPGSKLHISEPRPWLGDMYFVLDADGKSVEISREQFVQQSPNQAEGVEVDSRRIRFLLARKGVALMRREKGGVIYAIEIPPKRYRPELLEMLRGLPNLEQINLSGCEVTDEDLTRLPRLPKLVGIGLSDTPVTNASIDTLLKQPRLTFIEYAQSNITLDAMVEFEQKRPVD